MRRFTIAQGQTKPTILQGIRGLIVFRAGARLLLPAHYFESSSKQMSSSKYDLLVKLLLIGDSGIYFVSAVYSLITDISVVAQVSVKVAYCYATATTLSLPLSLRQLGSTSKSRQSI